MDHIEKIFAIIVTYNPNIEDFRSQLKIISNEKIKIIIIDNSSSNSLDILDAIEYFKAYEEIKFLANSENIGLAAAQNLGINIAIENDATHVVLFDQDSIPVGNFFNKLLIDEKYLLSQGVKFSAIGPTTFDPVSMKAYPVTKYIGPFIKRMYTNGNVPIEATFIIASGSLIRVNVLKEVGLMNADLFIDYVDVEWCLRAKSKGLCCYVSSSATMSHQVGDNRISFLWRTISAHSALRRYYLLRNSFYIIRLGYIPISYKIREITLNIARVLVFFFLSSDKINYIKFIRKALNDGLSKNYGKIKL